SLLVEAEREAEVDQLAECARPLGQRARLLLNPGSRRLDEDACRRAASHASELETRGPVAAEGVEVHDRGDARSVEGARREPLGAERPEDASVRGEEHDRVPRRHRAAWGPDRPAVGARELEQRSRPGRVVVRALARAGVVAMGHDDDRIGARGPDGDGGHVRQLGPATAGNRAPEPVRVRLEAERAQLVCDPAGGALVARRTRRAVRLDRDLIDQLPCVDALEGRRQPRPVERLRASDGERGDQERNGDDQPGPAIEPPVDRPLERAPARSAPGGWESRWRDTRAIVGRAEVDARRHAELRDDPARRRRGVSSEAADLSPRTGRLQRGAGARRRGGARPVHESAGRPRRPRPDAAEAGRARGLQAPARHELRPDHHADGPRRRARQGARARARRRRLHHQAVLDPGVPQPRESLAPPGGRSEAGDPRTGHDRGRRSADRLFAPDGRASRRTRPADLRRVRAAPDARGEPRPRLHAPEAARIAVGRLGLPRAAHDRRAHPPSPREARGRPARAAVHLHRARRRLPLPRHVNPLRSVGARLSLALLLVVAGALGFVYLFVVPSLQSRLISSRLHQLDSAAKTLAHQYRIETPVPDVSDAAGTINARVVLFAVLSDGPPAELDVRDDSRSSGHSLDVVDDPIAVKAATTHRRARGTVERKDQRFAEVALPAGSGTVLLLSAALHDSLSDVHLVQRRVLLAGGFALLMVLIVGYGGAWFFARRLRRLEQAAERIARGQFDQPVVDRGRDEVGELARTFETMRRRLAQLDHARREFIANASHELRTPLFALGGFVELLTDEEMDEETRLEFLSSMRDQVARLAKLATELLDLSRLDAGQLSVEREPLSIGEVARVVAGDFAAVARTADHPLEVLDGDVLAVADEQRVMQIGRILVENAILHT